MARGMVRDCYPQTTPRAQKRRQDPPAGIDGPARRELWVHEAAREAAPTERNNVMIGVVIAVLVAALAYALSNALGLPAIVGIVAAVLVLVSGIGTGGYGYRSSR